MLKKYLVTAVLTPERSDHDPKGAISVYVWARNREEASLQGEHEIFEEACNWSGYINDIQEVNR